MSLPDIGDVVRYPVNGDGAIVKQLVGGGVPAILLVGYIVLLVLGAFLPPLSLLAFLLIPLFLLAGAGWLGYFVQVARATYRGEESPPGIDDWGSFARDGFWASLLAFVYALPGLVVGTGLTVLSYVLGFATFFGAVGMADSSNDPTIFAGLMGMMLIMAVLGLVVMVGSFVYTVVVSYLLPISMLIYADEDRVVPALSYSRIKAVGFDADYALRWLGVAGPGFLVLLVLWALSFVYVGFFLSPLVSFLYFYLGVAGFYALGSVYADGVLDGVPTAGGDGPSPDTQWADPLESDAGDDAAVSSGR